MNFPKRLLFTALTSFATVLMAADGGPSLLPVFGSAGVEFSESAKGGNKITGWLPKGWVDNSAWGAVSVTYSKVADAPQPGVTAVNVNVTHLAEGQLQLTSWTKLAFKKGGKYVLEGWIRSRGNSDFKVLLREMEAPYETYAEQALETTSEWAPFVFPIATSEDNEGLLMFTKAEAGSVDLAGITVREVPVAVPAVGVWKPKPEKEPPLLPDFGAVGAEVSVSAKGGNKITGWLPRDWVDNSEWAAVSGGYTKLDDPPKPGVAAVRVQVTKVEDGQLQLTSFNQGSYRKGVKYVVEGWVRSKSQGGIKLVIRENEEPYKSCAELDLKGSAEWVPFLFPFSLSTDQPVLVMFTKDSVGTVDLAGITAHEAP